LIDLLLRVIKGHVFFVVLNSRPVVVIQRVDLIGLAITGGLLSEGVKGTEQDQEGEGKFAHSIMLSRYFAAGTIL
jgi:hypothetical protein